MIPRLTPRPTRSVSTQKLVAIENENSLTRQSKTKNNGMDGRPVRTFASANNNAQPVQPAAGTMRGQSIGNCSTLLAPPSPRRAAATTFATTSASLEAPPSPAVSQMEQDQGVFINDPSSALTPPATEPPPLVVSAKRLAHQVRRPLSSKRRRRRQQGDDGAAFCLWRDAGTEQAPQSSSEDEDEQEQLLLTSSSAQGYWEYCYGKSAASSTTSSSKPTFLPSSSWSASRKPPAKGCLLRKTAKSPVATGSKTSNAYLTPPTTPDDEETEDEKAKTPRLRVVQFGSPQAVEFNTEEPTAQLTPLPSEVTRQRYSMMQAEPSREEAAMSAETKRNSALLAEWEEEVQPTSSAQRRRQQRRNRRSSSIFTPSPRSSSLLEDAEVEETTQGNKPLQPSPATMVLENLASLCVHSPPSLEQPILTPASSSSEEEEGFSPNGPAAATSTTELAIPLNEVNVHGAASLQRTPSPMAADGTTVSTLNLQTIHSVGGALGKLKGCRELSPISRMTSHHGTATGDCLTPEQSRVAIAPLASSPDIVKVLLQDPSQDQVFDPKDIMLALAQRSKSSTSSGTNNRLAETVGKVSPRWDGVLSCLEDLKEQVRFCANTKSNTKFRLPANQEAYAKEIAVREWKELEIEFLLELSQAVERNREDVTRLITNASAFLEGLKPQIATTSTGEKKATRKDLENDIVKLEEEIHQENLLVTCQELAEAPLAALDCQALSLVGVCGFRLDEYKEASLRLTYEHPIAGVESQFTYDISQGLWSATYLSDAFISSSDLLPASHPASRFHELVAVSCFAGRGGLLGHLQQLRVGEAVSTLSQWLGGLDTATQELFEISKSRSIQIDWPRLVITLDDEASIEVSYESETKTSFAFHPVNAIATRKGSETEVDVTATLKSMVEAAAS